MDRKIFRAYDVRGIYGQDLTVLDATAIGIAFSEIMGRGTISVGRDVRLSSQPLAYAFMAGAAAMGLHIIDIGAVPSPMLYFSVAHLGLDGGSMVTASHNPMEYNGFKFCRKGAMSLSYDSGIAEMADRCLSSHPIEFRPDHVGEVEMSQVGKEYADYLLRDVDPSCRMKVVVEVGNGTCANIGELLSAIGCDVTLLHPEPDGTFPNGLINPAREETVGVLKAEVLRQGADLGVALDVDGDRVCFIDEKGAWTTGDVALAILAESILEKDRGAEIVLDIRGSRAVVERIQELGGKIRFTRVGHSYIANSVIDSEARIGGEISGHIYIHDRYYGYDDGIYTAIRMIEALTERREAFSEAKSKLRKMASSPEIRVGFPDELKFKAMDIIIAELEKEGIELNKLDGVRADFERGWFSIRASNTEPCLVLRMEGDEEGDLRAMTSRVYGLVSEAGRQLGHAPSPL